MSKPFLSLAMIVAPTDRESELLDRCLATVADHVDEICITITGRNKQCKEVAQKYGAHISYYKWDGDFATARNFNFSQAKGEWILWLDADDIVRNADAIKPLLQREDVADKDAVVSDYFYDFNEDGDCIVRHLKTMIIKNNGAIKWSGVGIHEDFTSERQIGSVYTTVFERIHQPDKKDIDDSRTRNLEIAKDWIEKRPDDPRVWWNLANSYMMNGRFEEAIDAWYEFIGRSNSDEEKYIAYDRLATAYTSLKRYDDAYEAELHALGIRPWYPDAWIGLGHLAFIEKKLKHAKFYLLEGMKLRPPTDEIIAYNPRTYDLIPLQLLAKVYYLNREPEKALECLAKAVEHFPKNKELKRVHAEIKKEVEDLEAVTKLLEKAKEATTKEEIAEVLESLPDEFKHHPMATHLRNVHFVKTETTGKEVTIFCSETVDNWSPDSLKTGIGGSEEAVIHLATRWAKAGYDVTVYNSCGNKEFEQNGIKWKPFWSWNPRDKFDVLVLWRHPVFVDLGINAKTVLVDLHDVIPAGEFTKERLAKIDKIMVKSKAHRDLFPEVPDEKFVIIPNGVDPSQFDGDVERKPYKMIYTSSPDRGLECAIKLFKEIKKQVPQATLDWYYGWNTFDKMYSNDADMMAWKQKLVKLIEETDGVTAHGRIGHFEIAKKYQEASVFFYPTEFYEIHCISAAKAQMAGAIPVTTTFAALDETVQFGLKIDTDSIYSDKDAQSEMIESAVTALRNNDSFDRKAMKEWVIKTHDWDTVAEKWTKYFNL